jgi:hypothetical protein
MYEQQLVMTRKQVMETLQYSESTLKRMAITGELSPLRRPDGKRTKVMYLKTVVLKHLEDRERPIR